MNISKLQDGIKLDILSMDTNYLNEEVFTKYSLLKYKNDYFLLFKSKYITGDELLSLNKVEKIYAEIIEEGVIIHFPNEINLGHSLSGYVSNGYKFNINNLVSIEKKNIDEKEMIYIRERM